MVVPGTGTRVVVVVESKIQKKNVLTFVLFGSVYTFIYVLRSCGTVFSFLILFLVTCGAL